jgi:hypothetical protein
MWVEKRTWLGARNYPFVFVCLFLAASPALGQHAEPSRFAAIGTPADSAPVPGIIIRYSEPDAFVLRVLGGVVGTAAGGLLAGGLWVACETAARECPHQAWIPALAITAAGAGTGVALAAEKADRRGAWRSTLLGSGLGVAPGAVVMTMAAATDDSLGQLFALTISAVGAVSGSIIGNYLGQ